jgi:hypothetical protein
MGVGKRHERRDDDIDDDQRVRQPEDVVVEKVEEGLVDLEETTGTGGGYESAHK